MINFSEIEIRPKIHLEIKNKPCLSLFSAEYKYMYYSDARNINCAMFVGVQKTGPSI